jgi:hypothetical protein
MLVRGNRCTRCIDAHIAIAVSVRMNFSHGSYEYHQSVIDNTRKMVAGTYKGWNQASPMFTVVAAASEGRPVAIALDTVSYLLCSRRMAN